MYYASPSDQGGWWGAGRWGVSMSEAPWHWLYKWVRLHAFHFPAHRSREELMGPSLIGDDWLQLGLPAHPDGLRIWQSPPPPPTPVSLGLTVRHKDGQRPSAAGSPLRSQVCACFSWLVHSSGGKGGKETIMWSSCFDLWLLNELWGWRNKTFPSATPCNAWFSKEERR